MAYPLLGFLSTLLLLLVFLPLLLEGGSDANIDSFEVFDSEYPPYTGPPVWLNLTHGNRFDKLGMGLDSEAEYGSGFFSTTLKIPGRNSPGVKTKFYLEGSRDGPYRFEFKLSGNRKGKPYTLQTEVYSNWTSIYETIKLWFDPTSSYHNYAFIRNDHQTVFYVDEIPIRVFGRNSGQKYPLLQTYIAASLEAEEGETIDPTQSPFIADFKRFNVSACVDNYWKPNDANCSSSKYWWNNRKYWRLSSKEEKELQNVRKKYLIHHS